MAQYFKDFPAVDYKFGDELTSNQFENIAIYSDVIDQVRNYTSSYINYYILPDERPDQISQKLYGSTDYYWTFFIMNDKADKGEIISKKKIYIANKDDAKKLYTKLVNSALKQLKFFLPKLENKKKIFLKKNKFNIGNYWRKRSEIDGQIDWRMNAKNIYNLTRALTKPYPFSHFIFKKKKINVLKAKIIKYKNLNIEPGKILKFKNDKYITIKCGEDALKIIKFKPRISFRKVKYII